MDEWIKKMLHTKTFSILKNKSEILHNDIHASLFLNNHHLFPVAYQINYNWYILVFKDGYNMSSNLSFQCSLS